MSEKQAKRKRKAEKLRGEGFGTGPKEDTSPSWREPMIGGSFKFSYLLRRHFADLWLEGR